MGGRRGGGKSGKEMGVEGSLDWWFMHDISRLDSIVVIDSKLYVTRI